MKVWLAGMSVLLIVIASCKTTSKPQTAAKSAETSAATPQESSGTLPRNESQALYVNDVKSAEPSASTPLEGPGTLPRNESQALYVKLLEIEIAKGNKIEQDKPHEVVTVFACEQTPLKSCSYRVRFSDAQLSASQPTRRELSDFLVKDIQRARPELKDLKLAKVNVICNYVGKASPPYTLEDVVCRTLDPRSPYEATFQGRTAEDLSEALRTNQTFGEGQTTLSGAVQCQWLSLSSRAACTVRVVTGGI